MAIASRQQLKTWFRNFMKPTQTQFAAWLDAYWHKDDLIPQESIEGWDEFLQGIPDMPNLAGYLTKDDTQNVVLGDDTKKLITDFMLLADWAENEKIKPSRLPDLAITTLVEGVVETSIAAFAANADNYDFQTGDVVPIIGSDNARTLYMFKGGDASLVGNYFVIDASKVALSNVIGLADALSDKMNKDFTNAEFQEFVEDFDKVVLYDDIRKKAALVSKEAFLNDIKTKLDLLVPAPDYVSPLASLSLTNKTVEVGSILNEAMTVSFTRNDAGVASSYTINKNGVVVSSTNQFTETDRIGRETLIYQGEVDYEAGELKNNLFGEPDPRGAITAGTVLTSNKTIKGELKIFYGVAAKEVETNFRNLPQHAFESSNNLLLNTGNSQKSFYVAVPVSMSLSSVIDLDALSVEIISQYSELGMRTVNDANGDPQDYRVYLMETDAPYSANHRHKLIFT